MTEDTKKFLVLTIPLGLFFLLKLLVYLPLEFSINSNLVDTVSAGSNPDQQHAIEVLGRIFSGVAVIIMLWGLLFLNIGRKWKIPGRVWVVLLLGSATLVILVFFGFKAAVNAYAASTTSEQRYKAVLLNLIPQAARTQSANILDLPCNKRWTYTGRTCLAMAGALLFYDDIALESVKKAAEQINDNLARKKVQPRNDRETYREYISAGRGVLEAYTPYRSASDQLLKADATSQLIWDNIDLIQKVQREFRKAMSATGVANFRNKLVTYFSRRWYPQAQSAYNQQSKDMFGSVVANSEWCDGTECPGDQAFVASKLRMLLAIRAFKEWHINPDDLGSGPEGVAAYIKGEFPYAVALPDKWWMEDETAFKAAVEGSIVTNANAVLASIQRQLGATSRLLPAACAGTPDQCFDQFEQTAAVQEGIRAALKRKMGFAPSGQLSVRWSWPALKERAIDPAVACIATETKAKYLGTPDSYGDQGKNAAIGRRAVRFILIATISLAFSLFFGLVNVASVTCIGMKLNRLIRTRNALIANQVEGRPGRNAGTMRYHGILAAIWLGLVAVIGLPLLGQVGVAAYPGAIYALDQAAAVAPYRASVVNWIVRIEPFVLPEADAIKYLYLGRDPIVMSPQAYDSVMTLDRVAIGWLPGFDDEKKASGSTEPMSNQAASDSCAEWDL